MNKNKRIVVFALASIMLSACAEKEQYEQAVLAQLKSDQDVKDYKIDPERMADCVVDTSSRNMPGVIPADSERKKAYIAYTKMLTLTKSKNPQQVMDELRKEFGSAQGLASAHSNFTDSILSCQTALISENEEKPGIIDVVETKLKTDVPAVEGSTNINAVQTAVTPDTNVPKTTDEPVAIDKAQTTK
jgi:hypothetical protein